MDQRTTEKIEWPNPGNFVHFIGEDGTHSSAIISDVYSRGDYPIALLGILRDDKTIKRWIKAKFDPDEDRPGTWHRLARGEMP